ncbi:hypothetical protein TNCV_3185361 [Trichonephila clavipes]|nr:hypothetical protein TNCV_3185361 [Trichonephila clavipes]
MTDLFWLCKKGSFFFSEPLKDKEFTTRDKNTLPHGLLTLLLVVKEPCSPAPIDFPFFHCLQEAFHHYSELTLLKGKKNLSDMFYHPILNFHILLIF